MYVITNFKLGSVLDLVSIILYSVVVRSCVQVYKWEETVEIIQFTIEYSDIGNVSDCMTGGNSGITPM